MFEINELEHLNEYDLYSKEYAMLHMFYATKNIIKRILKFIWDIIPL